mmetsp:Transcript_31321/g.68637  ORF Transcript_31321/g.68637 Transcript_31321/m.68637 type:complete len:479 (-) Transcript_31321:57-1493(-)
MALALVLVGFAALQHPGSSPAEGVVLLQTGTTKVTSAAPATIGKSGLQHLAAMQESFWGSRSRSLEESSTSVAAYRDEVMAEPPQEDSLCRERMKSGKTMLNGLHDQLIRVYRSKKAMAQTIQNLTVETRQIAGQLKGLEKQYQVKKGRCDARKAAAQRQFLRASKNLQKLLKAAASPHTPALIQAEDCHPDHQHTEMHNDFVAAYHSLHDCEAAQKNLTQNKMGGKRVCRDEQGLLAQGWRKAKNRISRIIEVADANRKDTRCTQKAKEELQRRRTPLLQKEEDKSRELMEAQTSLVRDRMTLGTLEVASKKIERHYNTTKALCRTTGVVQSYVSQVRVMVGALGDIPSLRNLPQIKFLGTATTLVNTRTMENDAIDDDLDEACQEMHGTPGAQSVRAATVSEILERSVTGLPQQNVADRPVIGRCPSCTGARSEKDGVGRTCWKTGKTMGHETMSSCHAGYVAAACVQSSSFISRS